MSQLNHVSCRQLVHAVDLQHSRRVQHKISFNGEQWCVTVRPMDNDDSESESSRRSKDGSDWPASQDSASQSVDDDVAVIAEDDGRQQHRLEVNEAKRAKLREIEVTVLCSCYCFLLQ